MEPKNNSGAIFKNAKKTNEKQPDYQGNCVVNGKEMQISLWLRQSQKGVNYFSAAFSEPYKKENQNQTYSNNFNKANDDLPF